MRLHHHPPPPARFRPSYGVPPCGCIAPLCRLRASGRPEARSPRRRQEYGMRLSWHRAAAAASHLRAHHAPRPGNRRRSLPPFCSQNPRRLDGSEEEFKTFLFCLLPLETHRATLSTLTFANFANGSGGECTARCDDVRVWRRAAGTQPLRYLQSGRRRCLPVAARAASSAAPGVFTRARAPSERGVWTGAGRLRGRGQAVLALTVLTQRYLLCSLTPGALRTMLRRRMGNSTHGGRKPQRHGRERRGSGASIMASSRSRSRLGSNHNCTHNSIA